MEYLESGFKIKSDMKGIFRHGWFDLIQTSSVKDGGKHFGLESGCELC